MLDTRLRGYDVYGFYQILIALLSFPRRRESRKWENSTFYETIKIDIAAKRRKKHKNKISGLVNSMCYNEQKLKFRLFTNPSKLTIEYFRNSSN